MTALEMIAAKKAERAAAGFAFRITYDNRAPFNAFYAMKEQFESKYAEAVASIGKRGPDGMTAIKVECL